MSWSADDIEIEIVAELSEYPVVTARIETPLGAIWIMGEIEERGRSLVVTSLHINSDSGPSQIGIRNLRALAEHVMARMDYDEIQFQGATRTSGARPGRTPRRLRFAGRHIPAPRHEY